jgi:hypothetical protein
MFVLKRGSESCDAESLKLTAINSPREPFVGLQASAARL